MSASSQPPASAAQDRPAPEASSSSHAPLYANPPTVGQAKPRLDPASSTHDYRRGTCAVLPSVRQPASSHPLECNSPPTEQLAEELNRDEVAIEMGYAGVGGGNGEGAGLGDDRGDGREAAREGFAAEGDGDGSEGSDDNSARSAEQGQWDRFRRSGMRVAPAVQIAALLDTPRARNLRRIFRWINAAHAALFAYWTAFIPVCVVALFWVAWRFWMHYRKAHSKTADQIGCVEAVTGAAGGTFPTLIPLIVIWRYKGRVSEAVEGYLGRGATPAESALFLVSIAVLVILHIMSIAWPARTRNPIDGLWINGVAPVGIGCLVVLLAQLPSSNIGGDLAFFLFLQCLLSAVSTFLASPSAPVVTPFRSKTSPLPLKTHRIFGEVSRRRPASPFRRHALSGRRNRRAQQTFARLVTETDNVETLTGESELLQENAVDEAARSFCPVSVLPYPSTAAPGKRPSPGRQPSTFSSPTSVGESSMAQLWQQKGWRSSTKPRYNHGLVPPHMAQQLAPFAFPDHPFHDPASPPRYSLDQGLGQLYTVQDDPAEGRTVRAESKELQQELADRVYELRMGYTVLVHAQQRFYDWLRRRHLPAQYVYQGLEEYAEGSAGGPLPYWPPAARHKCSEGANVRADWLLGRFVVERSSTGHLGPAQLAFLNDDDPTYFNDCALPAIVVVPPRNPSARIVGLSRAQKPAPPPRYSSDHDDDDPHGTDSSPDSSFSKGHSSDSGHGLLSDLIDLDNEPCPPSPRS
uniref:BY PROTMAP: gi/342320081/gb/EGU12024.1/ Proteophosphoglycan ppg4 [Rhodotorula glutinis ATCC 204091] n=1 Tax=Rhodotorula toruloides TaxID=5286 RepID=A0A0K3CAW0_RHOTO